MLQTFVMSKNYYINGLSPKGLELLFKFQWKLVVWSLYFMNLSTDLFGNKSFTNTSSRLLWVLCSMMEINFLFVFWSQWELEIFWTVNSSFFENNAGVYTLHLTWWVSIKNKLHSYHLMMHGISTKNDFTIND